MWESNPTIASKKVRELNLTTSNQRQRAKPLSHYLYHVFILPATITKFQTEKCCHLSQQNRWLVTSTCWLRILFWKLLTWFAENLNYPLAAEFICWLTTVMKSLNANLNLLTSSNLLVAGRKKPTIKIVFTFHIWITMETHLSLWDTEAMPTIYYWE